MEDLNISIPKLSIITVNLNNAVGLKRTIQCLVNQSFLDFELIVIDGGSTDASKDVIASFTDIISYSICEPDYGIYNAMNKGIYHATGEYCFFLNSGDYLADNRVFEKVFENNPKEDILFGNLYVSINGKVVGKSYGKKTISFSDIFANTIKHQAAFIKKSLFEKFGLYNEERKIIADWEFFIKSVGLGNATCRYTDHFIAYFDNDGISNHNSELVKIERGLVIQENIPRLMQPDFEFLLKYREYEVVYKNKFSFLIVRILNKILVKMGRIRNSNQLT